MSFYEFWFKYKAHSFLLLLWSLTAIVEKNLSIVTCCLEFQDSKSCLCFGLYMQLNIHLGHDHNSSELKVLDFGQQQLSPTVLSPEDSSSWCLREAGSIKVFGPDLLGPITPLWCMLESGRCRTCGVALGNQLGVVPAGMLRVILSRIPSRWRW